MTAILLLAALALHPAQDAQPAQTDPQPATLPAAQDSQSPPEQGSQPADQRSLETMTVQELLNDGYGLLDQQQWQPAMGAFRVVLQRDPSNIEAIVGTARASEGAGDFNTARQWYLKGKEIDTTDFRVNHGLGRAYLGIRQWRQALLYLEVAERTAPADKLAELKIQLASAYRGTGSRNRALKYAEEAVSLDPNSYAARDGLIAARLESQQYAPAMDDGDAIVRIAREAFDANPSNPSNMQLLLGAMQRKLQVLEAYHLSFYQRDPSGNPTDRLLPGQQADAARSLKLYVDAMVMANELQRVYGLYQPIMLIRKAVEYDQNNPELWNTLGLLYVNTSQVQPAIDAFRKALEADPANQRAAEQLERLNAAPTAPAADLSNTDGGEHSGG
jgi:tetratricopeptide (TPR) repeat protein